MNWEKRVGDVVINGKVAEPLPPWWETDPEVAPPTTRDEDELAEDSDQR